MPMTSGQMTPVLRSSSRMPRPPQQSQRVFASRSFDGSTLLVTMRLCLDCGSRFADRQAMRSYLVGRLPAHAREASVAPVVR